MKRELELSQNLMQFENLDELLSTIEDSIELHKLAIRKYGDRLGYLLRDGGSQANAPYDFTPASESVSEQELKKLGKGRKSDSEGESWQDFKEHDFRLRVANRNSETGSEVSVLFEVIESLKLKIQDLTNAKKLLAKFPSEGIRANQSFRVNFVYGLPRYVIPAGEQHGSVDLQRKFVYNEQFQISVLE